MEGESGAPFSAGKPGRLNSFSKFAHFGRGPADFFSFCRNGSGVRLIPAEFSAADIVWGKGEKENDQHEQPEDP
jgi:hypothetical protein